MQIVNQHGGNISLVSEVSRGAMFSVRLPVAK
jgi:signal transduction histidine kinase